MSKRSRCRQGHNNPALERRRRSERRLFEIKKVIAMARNAIELAEAELKSIQDYFG